MRVKHSYSTTRWTRKEIAEWIKSKACPRCKHKRLFPGGDNDRFLATCLQCGHRFAIKPPKDAVQ